jgi:hypothetical protein
MARFHGRTEEASNMTSLGEDVQPRTMARIAGFLYLGSIIFVALANVVESMRLKEGKE